VRVTTAEERWTERADAVILFRRAIEHRFEMAMALNGLAEANRGMGESGIARDYLSKADALFEQMGILGGCRWPTPGDLS
jgi:hypothetical protein